MRKEILVIGLLAAAIALSGCILPPPQEDLSGFRDCGESDECIFEAAKNGEQAFATIKHQSEGDPFSITVKGISYGFEDGKSKVKITVENIEATTDDDEAAAFIGLMGPMVQGQKMVCLLPPEKMASLEEMQFDEIGEYCSGGLIDMMNQFQ